MSHVLFRRFYQEKISKIDKKTVLVIGRFDLEREIGDLSGHYTLVIQKFGKEWLIISDHSTAEI